MHGASSTRSMLCTSRNHDEALNRIAPCMRSKIDPRQASRSSLHARQARSKPLLDETAKVDGEAHRVCHRRARQQLRSHALSRWRALTRYIDDGMLEIDNSAASGRTSRRARSKELLIRRIDSAENVPPPCTAHRLGEAQRVKSGAYLRTVLARIPSSGEPHPDLLPGTSAYAQTASQVPKTPHQVSLNKRTLDAHSTRSRGTRRTLRTSQQERNRRRIC